MQETDLFENNSYANRPQLYRCDGCNRYFRKEELKRCSECGRYFCPDCRMTHDCRAANFSPSFAGVSVPYSNYPSKNILISQKYGGEFIVRYHVSIIFTALLWTLIGLSMMFGTSIVNPSPLNMLVMMLNPINILIGFFGIAIFMSGSVILVLRILRIKSHFLKVTSQSVEIHEDRSSYSNKNIRLTKIDGVDVSAGTLDRLLGRGKIVIYSSGGRKIRFGPIGTPDLVRDKILEYVDNYCEQH